MKTNTNGCYCQRSLQHIYTTVYECYHYRTSQHMNTTANRCYQYRTLQFPLQNIAAYNTIADKTLNFDQFHFFVFSLLLSLSSLGAQMMNEVISFTS